VSSIRPGPWRDPPRPASSTPTSAAGVGAKPRRVFDALSVSGSPPLDAAAAPNRHTDTEQQ